MQMKVDVMLAVDLVQMSLSGVIQKAIIMAGDSDFVYAIEMAKNTGLHIHLYYSNHINDDLLHAVSKRTQIDLSFLMRIKL